LKHCVGTDPKFLLKVLEFKEKDLLDLENIRIENKKEKDFTTGIILATSTNAEAIKYT